MKYLYCTTEVLPDDLDDKLAKAGGNGWELIQLMPVQRYVKSKIQLGGQSGMQMELKYLLIFKKIDPLCLV